MIERNKQEVSNVSVSFVQQANGDIHNYGLAYSDVKAICHDVVRQGMILCVPKGSKDDPTRLPEFYDSTYEYLKSLGIEEI